MPSAPLPRNRRAFTLAELLVVMSIIVILLSVSGPALKGLLGGSSRKAAVGQMMGVFERARSTALQRATGVYVGFPVQGFGASTNPPFTYFRYIVFRDSLDGDPGFPTRKFVPLNKWESLPTGIAFGNGSYANSALSGATAADPVIDVSRDAFPPIPGATSQPTTYRLASLKFNGMGALELPATGDPAIWVLEGFYRTSDLAFVPAKKTRSGVTLFCDRITFARYTGRAKIDSVATP